MKDHKKWLILWLAWVIAVAWLSTYAATEWNLVRDMNFKFMNHWHFSWGVMSEEMKEFKQDRVNPFDSLDEATQEKVKALFEEYKEMEKWYFESLKDTDDSEKETLMTKWKDLRDEYEEKLTSILPEGTEIHINWRSWKMHWKMDFDWERPELTEEMKERLKVHKLEVNWERPELTDEQKEALKEKKWGFGRGHGKWKFQAPQEVTE